MNDQARGILRTAGVWADDDFDDYEILRKDYGYYGFANYYIQNSWDETELVNKANVNYYKELITIDEKLGTTNTQQLYQCVYNSLRLDLLKV